MKYIKKIVRNVIIISAVVIVSGSSSSLCAQVFFPESKVKMKYWDNERGMIFQQNKASLALADKLLEEYPPAVEHVSERKAALYLIDQVVHQDAAPAYPAVHWFLQSRIQRAAEEIRQTKVNTGAKIWKIYNDGYIVKTPSVTMGFDVVGRYHSDKYGRFGISPEIMEQLVDACDILFISHRHPDHYADQWVIQRVLKSGKKVVAPPDLWPDQPIYDELTHLPRVADSIQHVSVQDGKLDLKVVVYPGHQGHGAKRPRMNVVLVTGPEGLCFAHTGDQANNVQDFKWIDQVKNHFKVNVLMAESGQPYMDLDGNIKNKRMMKGFDPDLILLGHENELGHPVPHREPYWLDYHKMKGISYPFIILAWGESYHYKK